MHQRHGARICCKDTKKCHLRGQIYQRFLYDMFYNIVLHATPTCENVFLLPIDMT